MTSFEEFEKEINRFMESTGIRNFCRKYCKGKCCYNARKVCGRSCEKGKVPITCSLFVCEALAGVLRLKKYKYLSETIILKQHDRWKDKKIKIGEDEEKLLDYLNRIDWRKVSVRLAYLKDVITLVNSKIRIVF